MSTIIGPEYRHTTNGRTYYHFDHIKSADICSEISSDCRARAQFERMNSVLLLVAALAITYLAFFAVTSAISVYGLFTTALVIFLASSMNIEPNTVELMKPYGNPIPILGVAIATQWFYPNLGIVFLSALALKDGVSWWNSANHFSEQSHLADLKRIELLAPEKKA